MSGQLAMHDLNSPSLDNVIMYLSLHISSLTISQKHEDVITYSLTTHTHHRIQHIYPWCNFANGFNAQCLFTGDPTHAEVEVKLGFKVFHHQRHAWRKCQAWT